MMDRSTRRSFYDVISAAVKDITEHGFDTAGRLDYWTMQLRAAAERATTPLWRMEEMLRAGLGTIYRRLVERGEVASYHPGIARFTLQRIAPKLRTELDRRILASANLIKLNRQQAIDKTLQRFQGWSTSIPVGGSDATKRRETGKEIRKALASLPFEERRVLIDQGHKLVASINAVVAQEGGALALTWRSHWRQAGYDYREDHKDRDGKVYAIRGSWALERGLMKAGPAGYYGDITAVGEEVYCRCWAEYIYSLSSLPPEMLTKKGAEELAKARSAAA
jgi:hypothetical protein